ncbi:MAG: ArsR/SmtB family transcription factor [Acidimicrobiia bacterium]
MSTTLSALADDTRRGVVEALGQGPLNAGELAARLGVTPAALTRHLRMLRQSGVVSVSLDPSDSRRHVYSLHPEPVMDLAAWAEKVTEFWTRQLHSYTNYIEEENAGR